MTTMAEQLDELLATARSSATLRATANALDHKADMAPKGQTARPRRDARDLHKQADVVDAKLVAMRARFLKQHGGLS